MTKRALVITGASRGIGYATAELFLQQGFKVINLSRSAPDIAGINHLSADLSDSAWAQDISSALLSSLAGCNEICLVHNAGLLLKDSVESVDAASFHRALQVNVVAPAQLNQLLLPHMKPRSSIIYVGSTLSEKAVAGSCSYVVSKHAMAGLMKSTCQDLAGQSIHTACICPGFTETEMLSEHVGGDRGILDSIASGVTFNRLIEPAEIAKTLMFAATNPVVNGSIIHVNLGQIES